jgi:hypothetical protein
VLTSLTKLLIVPALFAVALAALATLLGCRALIGMCTRREVPEDLPA